MRSIHPGGRVLVEIGQNRFAKGYVKLVTSSWIRVALDGERVVHDWRPDQVSPLVEEGKVSPTEFERAFGAAS